MSKHIDLTGTKYGKLTVLGRGDNYISPSGAKLLRWRCQCECGNLIDMTTSQLKRGQKCGLCTSHREDLAGRTFGKLTVLYAVEDYVSPKGSRMSKWHCQCECGNEKDILGMSLKNGDAVSCGCGAKNRNNKKLVKDYTGCTFGDLMVLGKVEGSKPTKYDCICTCGNKRQIYQKDLTSGRKTHCGCKTVKIKDNKNHDKNKTKKAENVIGNTYGELYVLDELEPHITPNGSKQRIVKCLCSCGNTIVLRLTAAKKNKKCTKCLSKEKRIDISGQRFGKLVVLSMAEDYVSPAGHRLSRCNCICDCGKKCIVNMSGLVTGGTRSCGCLSNLRGLLKNHPEYMNKYDYELNRDIDLDKLTVASNKKVWWRCEKGHKWEAVVSSQTDLKKKHGCPYCSGRFVIKGETDLASQKPDILIEWDYDKNDINPDEISCFSGIKVWWKCKECGHSWKQTVANKVSGSGCPKCNLENVNSFCEQALYYYIKQVFPDAVNSDNHIGMELDIFIPSLSSGIEYDGEAWHKSQYKKSIDERKNKLCSDAGIELIRIREPKLGSISNCTVFVREDSTSNLSLDRVISDVLNYLSPCINIDVNTTRDTPIILEQYATKKYENSLAYCYPEIAKEWHPTKNGQLTPDKVNKSSRYKVWWLGRCGHEWDMTVSDRTVEFIRKSGKIKKQYGCPYCSGKRILVGFNDLKSQNPEIASEWDYDKNINLSPESIMVNSNKKVWWKCSRGHEWEMSPNRRNIHSGKCPICYRMERSPAVICVETGEFFENSKSAAAEYNIKNPERIYKCCRNSTNTVGGYHWKYYNDKKDLEESEQGE